ncbi:MAG: sigma-70 family RNA polymerase sigma factor [Polyangiaceae bacterium]|nr:sigma-70 family RNA polymerase sigma factor [Polyangiaceae bacterium]
MTPLRLVSNRPDPQPEKPSTHPCLEAFQGEFHYLVRSLRRLGVCAQDVEDLAHEVFLILYRTWDNYDPGRPLRAYLFGIAFRVAANHGRKRRRESPRAVADASDTGLRPDQALEAKQARALVLSALERIPLQRRAVLILHDIDELPMSEIASTLSIYRFTGYSRLRKARQEFAAAVVSLRGESEP